MKRKQALLRISIGVLLMAVGVILYLVTGSNVAGIFIVGIILAGFIGFTLGGYAFLKELEAQAKGAVEDAGESRAETVSEKKIEELDALKKAGIIDEQEYGYAVKRAKRKSE